MAKLEIAHYEEFLQLAHCFPADKSICGKGGLMTPYVAGTQNNFVCEVIILNIYNMSRPVRKPTLWTLRKV